ncbi:MAG: hypothetical protein ACPGWR_30845, partial [Ardenticatenaceae bacterium]
MACKHQIRAEARNDTYPAKSGTWKALSDTYPKKGSRAGQIEECPTLSWWLQVALVIVWANKDNGLRGFNG